MEPIINPSFFYWANVFDSLRSVSMLTIALSVVSIIILTSIIVVDIVWGTLDPKTLSTYKKAIIIVIVMLIIAIFIVIFIPTKETLYTMCAAEILTPDNIDAITEKGEKGIQFICEQIEQVINNTTGG